MKGKRNISENEKLHFGLEQIFHPMDIDRICLHVSDSDLGCNDTMRCNGEGNINTDSILKILKVSNSLINPQHTIKKFYRVSMYGCIPDRVVFKSLHGMCYTWFCLELRECARYSLMTYFTSAV